MSELKHTKAVLGSIRGEMEKLREEMRLTDEELVDANLEIKTLHKQNGELHQQIDALELAVSIHERKDAMVIPLIKLLMRNGQG